MTNIVAPQDSDKVTLLTHRTKLTFSQILRNANTGASDDDFTIVMNGAGPCKQEKMLQITTFSHFELLKEKAVEHKTRSIGDSVFRIQRPEFYGLATYEKRKRMGFPGIDSSRVTSHPLHGGSILRIYYYVGPKVPPAGIKRNRGRRGFLTY